MPRAIAIFTAQYLPHQGGVETFTFNLSKALAAEGNTVSIVTLSPDAAAPTTEVAQERVRVIRIPAAGYLGGRLPVAKRKSDVFAALEHEHVDSVVVNTRFYPHSLDAARFAAQRGIRPVVIDHGSSHLTVGNPVLDPAVSRYEHFATSRLKRFDADYYGISVRSAQWLEHFGIHSEGVIHNAIDAVAFRSAASSRFETRETTDGPEEPRRKRTRVAFVGRLVPEKGVESLVEAARSVPNADFLIAGDGPLANRLRENPPRNVMLMGPLPPSDIASLLLSADIFCLPSRSEGFATVLLEAAACSSYVISSDVGGAREVTADGQYGTIMPSRTPDAIADAIKASIGDEQLQEKAEKARERVIAKFSWASTAQATIDACEHAVRRLQ